MEESTMDGIKKSTSRTLADDRPVTSSETIMSELETEIMSLDETISELARRLQPVFKDKAESTDDDPRVARDAESPLAESLQEKFRRVSEIKRRVSSMIQALDI